MGFYPVMPGFRFAFDVDGTTVLRTSESGVWYEWSDLHKKIILSEDNRMVTFPSLIADKTKIAFVFPEPRTITAAFIVAGWAISTNSSYHYQVGYTTPGGPYPIVCEYSYDTTNGIDGSWSQTSFVNANPLLEDYVPLGGSFYPQLRVGESAPSNFSGALSNPVLPYYRSRAKAPQDALIDVKGVRLWMGPNGVISQSGSNPSVGCRFGVQLIHLYGSYASSSRSRVAFWRPTVDLPLRLLDVDLDDTQISGAYMKMFRLKNLSTGQSAVNVSLYVEKSSSYLGLSDFIDFYLNGAYYPSLVFPTIAAGGFSSEVGIRFRIPYSARMSTFPARMGFSIGAWV